MDYELAAAYETGGIAAYYDLKDRRERERRLAERAAKDQLERARAEERAVEAVSGTDLADLVEADPGPEPDSDGSELSAEALCEIWALRVQGGPFISAQCRGGNVPGEPGSDRALEVVTYMQRVPGFREARDLLMWVFGKGKSPSEFAWTLPGETEYWALVRRGWIWFANIRREKVPQNVFGCFMDVLRETMAERPFRYAPPSQAVLSPEDAEEQEQEAERLRSIDQANAAMQRDAKWGRQEGA